MDDANDVMGVSSVYWQSATSQQHQQLWIKDGMGYERLNTMTGA